MAPSFGNLSASEPESVIDRVLAKELELRQSHGDSLDVSWVYSNEGGVIRYAEIDLVGDEKKEIIYDRSTRGAFYKAREPIEVYFQTDDGALVKLDSGSALEGFQKKEGGNSIFLKASEGLNFDTADEKAFAKTLTIQEVSRDRVEETIHVINHETEKDLRELWASVLLGTEKKSIAELEARGFRHFTPNYHWVSLKDYISGDYEWKVDHPSDWSSLNEFEVESQTWKVHKDLVNADYLKVSRRFRDSLAEGELSISYDKAKLSEGYLTPKAAYGFFQMKTAARDLERRQRDEDEDASSSGESLNPAEISYLLSLVDGVPGESWEYSNGGGYLFRFEADVVGDSTSEVFFGSSLKNGSWLVLDEKYHRLGEVRIASLDAFKVRRSEDGASILDAFQLNPTQKFISEYRITKEGVEETSRQVSTEEDVKLFQILAGNSAEHNEVKEVAIDLNSIRLKDALVGSGQSWAQSDGKAWVLSDGYYLHEDDLETVRAIKSSVNEDEILNLIGGFTPSMARNALIEKRGETGGRKSQDQATSISKTPNSGGDTTSDRSGDRGIGLTGSLWAIATAVFLGGLCLCIKVTRRNASDVNSD